MRLPDWAWRRLERAYFAQRSIRRAELKAAVERQDAQIRRWADAMRAAHERGECLPECPFLHA